MVGPRGPAGVMWSHGKPGLNDPPTWPGGNMSRFTKIASPQFSRQIAKQVGFFWLFLLD